MENLMNLGNEMKKELNEFVQNYLNNVEQGIQEELANIEEQMVKVSEDAAKNLDHLNDLANRLGISDGIEEEERRIFEKAEQQTSDLQSRKDELESRIDRIRARQNEEILKRITGFREKLENAVIELKRQIETPIKVLETQINEKVVNLNKERAKQLEPLNHRIQQIQLSIIEESKKVGNERIVLMLQGQIDQLEEQKNRINVGFDEQIATLNEQIYGDRNKLRNVIVEYENLIKNAQYVENNKGQFDIDEMGDALFSTLIADRENAKVTLTTAEVQALEGAVNTILARGFKEILANSTLGIEKTGEFSADKLFDILERIGIVGPVSEYGNVRKVLVTKEELTEEKIKELIDEKIRIETNTSTIGRVQRTNSSENQPNVRANAVVTGKRTPVEEITDNNDLPRNGNVKREANVHNVKAEKTAEQEMNEYFERKSNILHYWMASEIAGDSAEKKLNYFNSLDRKHQIELAKIYRKYDIEVGGHGNSSQVLSEIKDYCAKITREESVEETPVEEVAAETGEETPVEEVAAETGEETTVEETTVEETTEEEITVEETTEEETTVEETTVEETTEEETTVEEEILSNEQLLDIFNNYKIGIDIFMGAKAHLTSLGVVEEKIDDISKLYMDSLKNEHKIKLALICKSVEYMDIYKHSGELQEYFNSNLKDSCTEFYENYEKSKEVEKVKAAIREIAGMESISIVALNNKLKYGISESAKMMGILEKLGIVGQAKGLGAKPLLMTKEDLTEDKIEELVNKYFNIEIETPEEETPEEETTVEETTVEETTVEETPEEETTVEETTEEETTVEETTEEETTEEEKTIDGIKLNDLKEAISIFLEEGLASVSLLQRRLKLGYKAASTIVDILEKMNIIGPFAGSKPRKILMTKEELTEDIIEELVNQYLKNQEEIVVEDPAGETGEVVEDPAGETGEVVEEPAAETEEETLSNGQLLDIFNKYKGFICNCMGVESIARKFMGWSGWLMAKSYYMDSLKEEYKIELASICKSAKDFEDIEEEEFSEKFSEKLRKYYEDNLKDDSLEFIKNYVLKEPIGIYVNEHGISINGANISPETISEYQEETVEDFIEELSDKNVNYDTNIIRAIVINDQPTVVDGKCKLSELSEKILDTYCAMIDSPEANRDKGEITYDLKRMSGLRGLFAGAKWEKDDVKDIKESAKIAEELGCATVNVGILTRAWWGIRRAIEGESRPKIDSPASSKVEAAKPKSRIDSVTLTPEQLAEHHEHQAQVAAAHAIEEFSDSVERIVNDEEEIDVPF